MTEPIPLQDARERVIDALCGRFADDTLTLSELERRLDHARAARTTAELQALLSDLPAPPTAPVPRSAEAGQAVSGKRQARPPTRGGQGAESGTRSSGSVALAVLGGTRRAGKWSPPGNMLAFALMGGVELDFRDAVLEPGSTTIINCFAFWGGIDITVPPDVYVDTRGFALLGGFEQSGEAADEPPAGAATIEVNGFALMGGVDVKVRDRGEARRRGSGRGRELGRGGREDV
jgi:hypothetical protein